MTRRAVHAASGHRLGAADPHQEGPADLRLVPPALAAWAAAAIAAGAPGRWTALAVALCLLGALLLSARGALRRLHRPAGAPTGPPGPGGPGAAARPPENHARPAVAGTGPGPFGLRRSGLNATACAGILLCAAAGASAAALHTADLRRGPLPALAARSASVTLEATVTSDPRTAVPRGRGDGTGGGPVVIGAEATEVTVPGGRSTRTRTPVLLVVRPGDAPADPARWQRLLPSTRLRVTGRLAPPVNRDDPFAAVLRTGDGPPEIIGGPSLAQRTAGRLRAGLREATGGLPADARALVPGITVGDTSRLSPELRDAFDTTDLSHVLAVSGSNLTIVLVLLIGPPGRAGRAERGGLAPRLGLSLRGTALAGGALTLAFVVVCRPEPSVLRAAACGAVALLAIGTGRRRSLVPALAAAVLLLVLYDPLLARNYGFLLSVLATGALLTIAPGWSAALRRRGVPPRIAEALAVALAAQAVAAPVVAVFAAKVSLVAVPCNLAAELATAPVTLLGFAALAVATVSVPLAVLPATVAGWFAWWIAAVARTGAALPGAGSDWPGGWWGGLLLAAVTVVVVLLVRRSARHPLAAAVCVVALLCAVVRPAPLTRVLSGWPPPGWTAVMCDVGQGDALVLAAGERTAVVVDTGPDPEPVDRCLRELGVTGVPLIVLTHFHADHVRGLPGVIDGRRVGAVQTTTLDEPRAQAEFVRRTATASSVPVLRAAAGERRRSGRLTWEVLWPDSGPRAGPAPVEANDASVTLLVRIADGPTLLLLGDLEPPAQRALLRARPGLGPVDVVKVAHHGSAQQDPGLLGAVRPAFALISAGRDNTYGHPAPGTVAALRSLGATVLRTDEDGPVALSGTGSTLRATVRDGRRPHPGAAGPGGAPDRTRLARGRRRNRPPRGPRGSGRPVGGPVSDRGPRDVWDSRTTRVGTWDQAAAGARPDGRTGDRLGPWTPISAGSAPPGAPSTRTPRPCATFSYAICGACRSRISPSTSTRRSCWRRKPCWTRSSPRGGAASATNSTEPSPFSCVGSGSASTTSRPGSTGTTGGSGSPTTIWRCSWRPRTARGAGWSMSASANRPTTPSPSICGRTSPIRWVRSGSSRPANTGAATVRTAIWWCCATASRSTCWRPGRVNSPTSGPVPGGTAPRPSHPSPGR